LALGVVVLVTAAGVGWAVWGENSDYQHALVKYDNDQGESNRYVDLDDGKAQLSIGSPNGHRIVVQWRDPDGQGWTAPQTVWTDKDDVAIENTVRYGGGTVAVVQAYTPDVHSDSDIGVVRVGIVCRALACTAQRSPGFGGEAQVTPDGRTAYLGQDEKGVYLWTSRAGIHRASWVGHPGFEYGVVSPSEPVLAPDGSLRVVTSKPSRGSCTYELLASASGTAALTPVGHTTERLRGLRKSDCRSSLRTDSANWVEVADPDHPGRVFWFVRDGDAWAPTRDDPSGLRPVDVDQGCCDSSIIGFVHWNDVAFGSPDGRRILVQTKLLGKETWSEVQVLEGAPAGYRCTWQEGYEVGEQGFAVLMTCHSGKVRNEFRGDAYAVAVTPDLHHWESTFVSGVRRPPQVDRHRVRVGETTWTPEGGFVIS
jgi:hypothetical protein